RTWSIAAVHKRRQVDAVGGHHAPALAALARGADERGSAARLGTGRVGGNTGSKPDPASHHPAREQGGYPHPAVARAHGKVSGRRLPRAYEHAGRVRQDASGGYRNIRQGGQGRRPHCKITRQYRQYTSTKLGRKPWTR